MTKVAPRAGAWIETSLQIFLDLLRRVAPRAGAWIETHIGEVRELVRRRSHPVRVRGLKH